MNGQTASGHTPPAHPVAQPRPETRPAGAAPSAPAPTRPRAADLARAFFGVAARRRTWLAIVYMLTAFPLGLAYFVILVTGLSLGLGLAILWVGIPILLLVAAGWWVFAAFERLLARGLLGIDCGPNPRPWESQQGALGKLRAHLTDASTWKDLAFVALKFPLGVVSFSLLVSVAAAANALVFAPAISLFTDSDRAFDLGIWRVDGWIEALPLVPLGVIVFFVGLHLIDLLGSLWRLLVEALLRQPPAARQSGPRPAATPHAIPAGASWGAPSPDFARQPVEGAAWPPPATDAPAAPPEAPASPDKEVPS